LCAKQESVPEGTHRRKANAVLQIEEVFRKEHSAQRGSLFGRHLGVLSGQAGGLVSRNREVFLKEHCGKLFELKVLISKEWHYVPLRAPPELIPWAWRLTFE
jgi:hypothetical protein